ncbi:sororin [Hyperolius riggenbachi]|uniref:sororin n=1 Tax=Hyperolius riggenbachi TaxID=752182 RepID=UPI0035A2761C
MSAPKRRGGSRGTVTWSNVGLPSPPTRRSGRNSALLNKSTNSSGLPSPSTKSSERNSVPLDKSTNSSGIPSPPTRRSERNSAPIDKSTNSSGLPSPPTRRSERNSAPIDKSTNSSGLPSPPTRTSGRNSSSLNKCADSQIPAPVIMKRSVTAKKIMPRKTLAALASAESQPKTASTESRPKTTCITQPVTVAATLSTPSVPSGKTALRRSSRVSPNAEKENSLLDKSKDVAKALADQLALSKIDILSPIPLNIPQSPSFEDREKVMSEKVRRSYSRLSLNNSSLLYSPTRNTDSSDTSTPNSAPKAGRRSLFGFDKLLNSDNTEEEMGKNKEREERKRSNAESGTSLVLSTEDPDPNIPGVAVVKQKRRKRRVPQIEKSDLDEWAAAMNAEFDEAEKFDLTVE